MIFAPRDFIGGNGGNASVTSFMGDSFHGFKRHGRRLRLGARAEWLFAAVLLALCFATTGLPNSEKQEFVSFSKPQTLSFEELMQLEQTERPEGQLASRLDTLLHTPFLSNEAYLSGAKPNRPSSESLGPFIRAICWNIERGIQFDAIRTALAEPEKFDEIIAQKKNPKDKPLTPEQLNVVKKQLDLLKP